MGLEKELAQVINNLNKGGTKPYDTSAVVKRVEGSTAWVHIDGGVEETPVEMTIACKAGDTVKVRLSGGMAYLLGNNTAPPTDDRTALEAMGTAGMARRTAIGAAVVANTTKQRTRPAITSMITYYKLSNGTPPQPTEESHAGWSEEEPEWDPEGEEQLYYSVRSKTVQGIVTWSNPHVLSSYANMAILQNAILLEVGEGSTLAYIDDEYGNHLTDENDEPIYANTGSITDAYAQIRVMANEIMSEVSETYVDQDTINDVYSRIQIQADEILQEVSETYVNMGTSEIQSLSSVMRQTAEGLNVYSTVDGELQSTYAHIDDDEFSIRETDGDDVIAKFGTTVELGKPTGARFIQNQNVSQWLYETKEAAKLETTYAAMSEYGYARPGDIIDGFYSIDYVQTEYDGHSEVDVKEAFLSLSGVQNAGISINGDLTGSSGIAIKGKVDNQGSYGFAMGGEVWGPYGSAIGYGLKSAGACQTVIGSLNVVSYDYAFIIGGGDSIRGRKNILAVDWDGNIHLPAGKQVLYDL